MMLPPIARPRCRGQGCGDYWRQDEYFQRLSAEHRAAYAQKGDDDGHEAALPSTYHSARHMLQ